MAAEEAGISEQAMRERPAKPVLDCSKSENEKCLECGYEGDDIEYCCRSDDDCDIINAPPPESEPIGGYGHGFQYDSTLIFVSW